MRSVAVESRYLIFCLRCNRHLPPAGHAQNDSFERLSMPDNLQTKGDCAARDKPLTLRRRHRG